MPRISVLMPVYNGAQYLERSIGSVLSQTCGDWELIVLDDGSSDDSPQVLARLQAADSRIRVLRKANDGHGNTARNLALMTSAATGDYGFYMSQDDWLSDDLLEKALRRAGESGADVVIPDMLTAFADGSTGTWACSYPPGGNHSTVLTGREAFEASIDFGINGFALIAMRLLRDGRCDTRYFDSDEYNTRLQYLQASKVAFCDGTFYYYRGNAQAITQRFSPRRFERLPTALMLYKLCGEVYGGGNEPLRLYVHLMRMYAALTVMLFSHRGEMSDAEYAGATGMFRKFEKEVGFKGRRLAVARRLNVCELLFAAAYFATGSCLWLSRAHALYKRLRGTWRGTGRAGA